MAGEQSHSMLSRLEVTKFEEMSAANRLIARFVSCRSDVMPQARERRQVALAVSAKRGILARRISSTSPPQQGNSGGKRQSSDDEQRWWRTDYEFKVVTLLALGLGTHIATQFFQRRHKETVRCLQHVNQQIEKLYGPLYGNRLVQEKVFLAVMGEYKGLKTYLKQAEDTKDAAMIRQWRSFLTQVLYPLDQKASALITQNGHLIVDNDFPPSFDRFLTHLAKLQFLMERWKNENGKLELMKDFTDDDYLEENNASGDGGVSEMFRHVEMQYKKLKALQKELEIEAHVDATNSKSLGSFDFFSRIKKLI